MNEAAARTNKNNGEIKTDKVGKLPRITFFESLERHDFDFKDVPKADYPIVERLVRNTPNHEGASFGAIPTILDSSGESKTF